MAAFLLVQNVSVFGLSDVFLMVRLWLWDFGKNTKGEAAKKKIVSECQLDPGTRLDTGLHQ